LQHARVVVGRHDDQVRPGEQRDPLHDWRRLSPVSESG
jgi:hypothetical protein